MPRAFTMPWVVLLPAPLPPTVNDVEKALDDMVLGMNHALVRELTDRKSVV